jgi:hypothetical protein
MTGRNIEKEEKRDEKIKKNGWERNTRKRRGSDKGMKNIKDRKEWDEGWRHERNYFPGKTEPDHVLQQPWPVTRHLGILYRHTGLTSHVCVQVYLLKHSVTANEKNFLLHFQRALYWLDNFCSYQQLKPSASVKHHNNRVVLFLTRLSPERVNLGLVDEF